MSLGAVSAGDGGRDLLARDVAVEPAAIAAYYEIDSERPR